MKNEFWTTINKRSTCEGSNIKKKKIPNRKQGCQTNRHPGCWTSTGRCSFNIFGCCFFHICAFLETGPKPVLFNFTVTSQEPIQSALVSVPVTEASNLYCQPCGINFTSLPHATQHYQGKNHAKKLKSLTAASQINNQNTIVGSQKSLGKSTFLYCLTAGIWIPDVFKWFRGVQLLSGPVLSKIASIWMTFNVHKSSRAC